MDSSINVDDNEVVQEDKLPSKDIDMQDESN